MKLYYIIFTLLILTSCSNEQTTIKNDKTSTDFNLIKDIFEFPTKLSNNDTLIVLVNLSNCEYFQLDSNIITKKSDSLYIETFIQADYIKESEKHLERTKFLETNSLSFSQLFKTQFEKGIKKTKINSAVIGILHKSDSIIYYSNGLSDLLSTISDYVHIQQKIRPNVEIYQPVTPPPPPVQKPDSFEKIIIN